MNLTQRVLSTAMVTLAGALSAAHATAQCISGGPGGAIPAAGDGGGGTWPTTLPATPFSTTLSVVLPGGATVLNAIKLHGVTHTWAGDLQFVLESPSGAKHNILCGMPTDDGGYFGAGADITVIDASVAPTGTPVFPWNGSPVASGTYKQDYGGHPTGTNGIDNTPIEQIPIASGNWKLHIFDWAMLDAGALTSWELCFGSPTPPPPPCPAPPTVTCVAGGLGGLFPNSGVDGTWPTVLPTGELASPLAVTVPAGSSAIVAVKLLGLSHTWVGDIHVVLESPAGTRYNVFYRPGSVTDSFGLDCDPTGGDYTVIDGCFLGNLDLQCNVNGVDFDAGTYAQSFGDWPSGSAGVNNVALGSIPLANGIWVLRVYDWYVSSDDGSITGWELCFDTPGAPTAYCTPTTPGTSNACIPTIAGTNNPNVAHSNTCILTVSSVEAAQTGLVFYGITGPAANPWCSTGGNSFLCVKAPLERAPVQATGGVFGTCTGSLSLNWNAFQLANPLLLGNPWSVGDKAWVQGWFRDPPSCKTTFLSQALVLTYSP